MAPPGVVTLTPESPSVVGPTAPRDLVWTGVVLRVDKQKDDTNGPSSVFFGDSCCSSVEAASDQNCYYCCMLLLVLLHDGCRCYY